MKYIVYQTRNNINGKIYVGIHKTKDPNVFDGYYGNGNSLKHGKGTKNCKTPFDKALRKYGLKNFSRIVLLICDTLEEAKNYEATIVNEEFIKRKDTYNICIGGGVPPNSSKRVFQYNQQGDFVCCYDSVAKAAKEIHKSPSALSSAIKNRSLTNGYYWSYIEISKLDISQYRKQQRKDLYVYDSSGNYIKSFNSYSEFCRTYHTSTAHVKRAIKTGTKCKGFYLSTEKVSRYIRYKKVSSLGKIFQYDLQGTLIKEYASVNEITKKTCFIPCRINAACKDGRPYHGYLWSRGDSPVTVVKMKDNWDSKRKKVGRFSLDGTLIEEFNSVKDARLKFGGSVAWVLRGAQAQTKGFIFRYL